VLQEDRQVSASPTPTSTAGGIERHLFLDWVLGLGCFSEAAPLIMRRTWRTFKARISIRPEWAFCCAHLHARPNAEERKQQEPDRGDHRANYLPHLWHSNHEGVSNHRGAWNDVIIGIGYCKAENKYAQ
jgi:hypothetical protein